MNSGTASKSECNPSARGAASKRPSEDSGEEPPRERRQASTAWSGDYVSWTDGSGWSRLHYAAVGGDVDGGRRLIRRGADTRLRDRGGRTPLHCALYRRNEAVAELLAGADHNNDVQDDCGSTPLHLAAARGYVRTIRVLLAGGSRTRVRDEDGQTPLHRALDCEKEAAAELLVEADCSNDVRDIGGRTPLHLAALSGYEGTMRKLVESGMNPHVKDASGQYPFQINPRWKSWDENIPKMILSSYALKGIPVDREELRLEEGGLLFCMQELSRCDVEIRLMRHTRVPASSVSYLDLVRRHVGRVASCLLPVWGALRSYIARRDFPIYAGTIAFRLQAVGKRRVRREGCLECFSLLSPPLPPTCADVVVLCLSDDDLENFVRAVRLEARE